MNLFVLMVFYESVQILAIKVNLPVSVKIGNIEIGLLIQKLIMLSFFENQKLKYRNSGLGKVEIGILIQILLT